MILFSCALIVTKVFLNVACLDPSEYGVFELNIIKHEICVGPKSKSCGRVTILPSKQRTRLVEDIEVLEEMVPDSVKVSAFSSTASTKENELIKYQMQKPCHNIFLKPVIYKLFNMTDKCVIKKGIYRLDLDMQEMQTSYYGNKFFYGDFTFKWSIYSKKCNLGCIVLAASFRPKL